MPSLAEMQHCFAAAILDPTSSIPAGLVGPDGEASVRRFAVYRNNVVLGLSETLKDAFPAVHRIVGAAFFQAMARVYVAMEPPRTPMMFDYGAGFPGFIERFEPAALLPYLADVARIERAWTESYHAAEALSVSPSVFVGIPRDRLPEIRLMLHPSVRLVRSRFPALTIWRMNAAGGVPGPVDLEAGGEDVLIIRPDAEIEVRAIPPGSLSFIHALAAGRSVLAACEAALAAEPRFNLAANLVDLVGVGAVVGLSDLAEPRPT